MSRRRKPTAAKFARLAPVQRPAPARFRVDWRVLLAGGVLAAAGTAAYLNSFAGVFLFDDIPGIPDKQAMWRNMSWLEVMLHHPQTPVMALTLKLNYVLGGRNPWGYHLVNLVIHLLAGLALMGIVRRTLLTERLRGRLGAAALPLALATALLWTLHPLQTQSVTYVIQRKESLMGLFYLLTLYCAIRADGRWKWGWRAAAVIACTAGMWTKQVMVTAPVAVLLYDRTFLSGSFRKALRRNWAFYLLLAATWATLVTSLPRFQEQGAGVPEMQLGRREYAQTQLEVVVHYLRLAFWPAGQCLDYGWPVARTWQEVLPQGVGIALLLAATGVLLWRVPAAGFAAAWVFLVLAPTSTIIVITELAFEHRMYVPLAGLSALVVVGGYAAGQWVLGRARAGPFQRRLAGWIGAGLAIGLAAALGVLSFLRNFDYHSVLGMARDVVAKRPQNPRGHLGLGLALGQAGDYDGAIRHFDRAIELKPGYPDAHNNRGVAYRNKGMLREALADFTRAIAAYPGFAGAYNNRAGVLNDLGRPDRALQDCDKAIELQPEFPDAYYTRGVVHDKAGRPDLAVRDYTRAIQQNPDFAEAYNNRGGAYGLMKQNAQAVRDCTRAIELKPDHAGAYLNRALAHYYLHQYDRAWEDIQACQRLGRPVNETFRKAVMSASGRRP